MRVVVPKGVDLTTILKNQGIKQKKINELKPKFYFFLSKVVVHSMNFKFYEENNGYRTICLRKMTSILGRRHFDFIIKVLKDGPDKVIESNGKYMNGKFCYGYRLTEKFRTGEISFKNISGDFIDKKEELPVDFPDYSYLNSMFTRHNLQFEESLLKTIENLSIELKKYIKNKYQEKIIFNYIGMNLKLLEMYESKNYLINTSGSNFRYYSIIVNTPKYLRSALKCNNEELIEIDLKSSQPFLFATIINLTINNIISENRAYNDLNNCNVALSNSSIDTNLIDINNSDLYLLNKNNKHASNTSIDNNDIVKIKYIYNISANIYSLIARVFEEEDLKDDLIKYVNSPFHSDFYLHVANNFSFKVDREHVKKYFMFFLFSDNQTHRNTNRYITEIARIFPSIDFLITEIHKEIGKREFSKILQKIESKLLLDTIVREFYEANPNCPIFTVHDGIYTTKEYSQDLHKWIYTRLYEVSGLRPGLGLKSQENEENLYLEKVKEKLKDWKNIKSEHAFEKYRQSIFLHTYDLGKKFVNKVKL